MKKNEEKAHSNIKGLKVEFYTLHGTPKQEGRVRISHLIGFGK